MKITYDPEVDILRIILSDVPIEDSDEEKPGVILDYDENGNIIGLEILDVSKRIDNPLLHPSRTIQTNIPNSISTGGTG